MSGASFKRDPYGGLLDVTRGIRAGIRTESSIAEIVQRLSVAVMRWKWIEWQNDHWADYTRRLATRSGDPSFKPLYDDSLASGRSMLARASVAFGDGRAGRIENPSRGERDKRLAPDQRLLVLSVCKP